MTLEILKALADRALDIFLPPRCAVCGALIDQQGGLCASCWSELSFIAGSHCRCCGLPFELPMPPETLCPACITSPPEFDKARAALRYDEASKKLLLAFKHGDRTEHGRLLARWLSTSGAELLSSCDIVVPVPLHWRRLAHRRYNQSAILARYLAQSHGLIFDPMILRRVRATRSQGGLGVAARKRNLQGAFDVPLKQREKIQGKRLLLIDDVYTTGATIKACSRILRASGAAAVDVLCVARVLKES